MTKAETEKCSKQQYHLEILRERQVYVWQEGGAGLSHTGVYRHCKKMFAFHKVFFRTFFCNFAAAAFV